MTTVGHYLPRHTPDCTPDMRTSGIFSANCRRCGIVNAREIAQASGTPTDDIPEIWHCTEHNEYLFGWDYYARHCDAMHDGSPIAIGRTTNPWYIVTHQDPPHRCVTTDGTGDDVLTDNPDRIVTDRHLWDYIGNNRHTYIGNLSIQDNCLVCHRSPNATQHLPVCTHEPDPPPITDAWLRTFPTDAGPVRLNIHATREGQPGQVELLWTGDFGNLDYARQVGRVLARLAREGRFS